MANQTVTSSAALRAEPAPTTWHRFTNAVTEGGGPAGAVQYGADLPSEAQLRLLGPIEGHRILDLGCGNGQAAVSFARQRAKVIAVDPSSPFSGGVAFTRLSKSSCASMPVRRPSADAISAD